MAFTTVRQNPGRTDRPPDIDEGRRFLIGDECRIFNTERPTLSVEWVVKSNLNIEY